MLFASFVHSLLPGDEFTFFGHVCFTSGCWLWVISLICLACLICLSLLSLGCFLHLTSLFYLSLLHVGGFFISPSFLRCLQNTCQVSPNRLDHDHCSKCVVPLIAVHHSIWCICGPGCCLICFQHSMYSLILIVWSFVEFETVPVVGDLIHLCWSLQSGCILMPKICSGW